ncbi:MAG TPA: hypothetical protein VGC65_08515 [Bacteroidia bacterium]|jgi:hypothetical protein
MIRIKEISESNIQNVDEIIALSKEAETYLSSFEWCNEIIDGWLVKDWGFMLCIFYFKIAPSENSGADNSVWIIVGDIPPAYIDIKSGPNEYEALSSYIFLMEDWINHVNQNKSVKDCYPINVEPSKDYANMLSSRIKIIKEDFLPEVKKELN